jgi:acyl-CoA thioester hydrolase
MQGYHTELELRIDWADLDLFGHVNNVVFFKYIQACRVNYCEKIGLTSLNDPSRHSFMVASSQCQFRKPLTYPGNIKGFTKTDWIKNTSLQLSYTLMNDAGELVAEASDVIVVFDHHLKTKVTITDALKKTIEDIEQRAF